LCLWCGWGWGAGGCGWGGVWCARLFSWWVVVGDSSRGLEVGGGFSAVILRADAWVWEVRGGDGGHGGLQQKGFI
jgi:hypothetical protein